MEETVDVFSKAFCPEPDTENFSIRVSQHLWEKVIREELGNRVFLKIKHEEEGFPEWIAPMGQPVREDDYHPLDRIYLPLWMMDSGHFHDGLTTQVEFLSEESFPNATHLVFRVIDSMFYDADVKDELEKALSAMGVIREHTTLQIPIESLDGYRVDVFVSKTEPANIVLCQGEEVSVEFEQPVDHVEPSPPRPPTPVPSHVDDFHTLLSPDLLHTEEPLGFQAFQGVGQTLGSSNNPSAGPAWRRGLPIPRPRRDGPST
jgi:hypothetical protein